MLERYSLPEMAKIWTDEHRLSLWLRIEILACEGWVDLGRIPPRAVRVIREKADFSWARVQELEETTQHDVLAFLTNVAEAVGDDAKYLHLGLTSSDIVDTALSLQLLEAADILLTKLYNLTEVLEQRAWEHKDTLMVGRTHGVHAEPLTLGLKFALWYDEMKRQTERLKYAREEIRVGKISGAVGTFANVDPRVEEYVCRQLGLRPAPVSTQILQRDSHAFFLTTLAGIAGTLDKISTEVRNLQRTDIHEVEEGFGRGQKGSSAMPHKKNPITAERISGLARVIRANSLAALENVVLWHERDISHSSAERVILPDSTIALDYMLYKMTQLLTALQVFPEQMKKNLDKTGGLIFSQRVLLALVEKGMSRELAYASVQRLALRAWETDGNFQDLIRQDPEIKQLLCPEEILELFSYAYHTKHVDEILRRVGIGAN